MYDDELLDGLLAWLAGVGLLRKITGCKKPDGTFGDCWVLHKPSAINRDQILGWHPTFGRYAVEQAMKQNKATLKKD